MMNRLVLLVAMIVIPLTSQAASFDCKKASTEVEQAICADPELSRLDEQLSKVYKQEIQKGPKAQVQAAQRAWLKERGVCGADTYFLASMYNKRIAQLQGVRWSLADWQRAAGTWSLAESNALSGQRLEIKAVSKDGFEFVLYSFAGSGSEEGTIEGQAHFSADGAVFKHPEADVDCPLLFIPLGKERMYAGIHPAKPRSDFGTCSDHYGPQVEYGGLFIKGIHQKELSLVDLGVFKTPAEDQAFRAMVGNAYHVFVESNPGSDEETEGTKDIDGLGAEVATGQPR
jgi:uncharacterized protein